MTTLGLIGALLGLAIYPFAVTRPDHRRIVIFVLAWVLHLASSAVYYNYAQSNIADATFYYYDPYNFYYRGFQFNTWVIIAAVQWTRGLFGGTMLDYFLLFQAIGFWGLGLLMRTVDEVFQHSGEAQPLWIYFVVLLPGLHFWSSAIGKDSVLFFAAALVMWATMRLERRFLAFGAGVGVMLLVRPHIALAVMISFAAAALVERRIGGLLRLSLLVVGAAGAMLAFRTLESTQYVNFTSMESVSNFVSAKAPGSESFASYPMRVLSLLFLPLFFDAKDFFGLVASAENVFQLYVIGFIMVHAATTTSLVKRIFALRFAFLFALSLILLLSYVYYNVGLGLRQRLMYMPALLTVFAAVHAVRRARNSVAADRAPFPSGVKAQHAR